MPTASAKRRASVGTTANAPPAVDAAASEIAVAVAETKALFCQSLIFSHIRPPRKDLNKRH